MLGQGITKPSEPYFQNGLWGWNGSAWVKLPVLLGFTSVWDVDLGGAAVGATYSASAGTVPAGQIWTCQTISVRDNTTAVASIAIYVQRASGGIAFLDFTVGPAIGIPAIANGVFTLAVGDSLWVALNGTVVADVIQGAVLGYKQSVS